MATHLLLLLVLLLHLHLPPRSQRNELYDRFLKILDDDEELSACARELEGVGGDSSR